MKTVRIERELYEKVEAAAKKMGKTPEEFMAAAVKIMARQYGIKC